MHKSQIKNNKYETYDCYLINYIWMENYKNFYLYNELIGIIEKELNKISIQNKKYRVKIIFEKIPPEFINKINERKKLYFNQDFEDEESIHHTINKSKENFLYPDEFQIINEEVYDLIKNRRQIKLNQTKMSYIINSNKIIMQYNLVSLYELLIMRIDFQKKTNLSLFSSPLFSVKSQPNI